MYFEKDWRGLIPSALWSWILCWIPSLYVATIIYLTKYSLQGSGVLQYKTGIIHQRYINIDLYRIKNASAEVSLISGGKIILTNNDNSTQILPYVKNADEIALKIRDLVNQQREQKGVKPFEMM